LENRAETTLLTYLKRHRKPTDAGHVVSVLNGVFFDSEHELKQEITLSHGQHCGRLTSEKLSVGNHLIGFGIYRYFRLPIVVNHVGLSELADAADGPPPLGQAVFRRNPRSHCRLRNKSQRRS